MKGLKNLPGEIWKDVPGYEGLYKVSNMGRVLNLLRMRMLKASIRGSTGNLSVSLRKNDITKQTSVKTLVFTAFKGYRPHQIGFLDGNSHNVTLDNLREESCASRFSSNHPKDILNIEVNNVTMKTTEFLNTGVKYDIIIGNEYNGRKVLTYLGNHLYQVQCIYCGKVSTVKRRSVYKSKCKCSGKQGVPKVGLCISNVKVLTLNKGDMYLECLDCHSIFIRATRTFSSKTSSNKLFRCPYCTDSQSNSNISGYPHKYYIAQANRLSRCYDPSCAQYSTYGGKQGTYSNLGIRIFKFWLDNPRCFYDYVHQLQTKDGKHYYDEGIALDRIDPWEGYLPWNLQLLTQSENSRKVSLDKKNYPSKEQDKFRYSLNKLRNYIRRFFWYRTAVRNSWITKEFYKKYLWNYPDDIGRSIK